MKTKTTVAKKISLYGFLIPSFSYFSLPNVWNGKNSILAVKKGKDIVILEFDDIYMFRVEDKQLKVFTEKSEYLLKKPLYQIEDDLDSNFVRISKSTIVNMRKIERVAPSLKGMMFISLKNGLKDNISRKYLPDFKNALGL